MASTESTGSVTVTFIVLAIPATIP